jgi:hypothetical protein
MCTVSFLPLDNGDFILTSNRDERSNRPSEIPSIHEVGNQYVLFPRDPEAGGTWIATNPYLSACLLNGAYIAHERKGPYRKSRGLVLLDAFNYPDAQEFALSYDFKGIEPFTLILIEEEQITELRWDGHSLFNIPLPWHEPRLWASSTLYSPEVISRRLAWFEEWQLEHPSYTLDGIRQFHQFGGDQDPENGLQIHRKGDLMTTSITSAYRMRRRTSMIYEDLLKQVKSTIPY